MVKVTEIIYKRHNDFLGTLTPVEEHEIGEFNSEGEALDAVGADEYMFVYHSHLGGWEKMDHDEESNYHKVYRIEELA